MTIKRIKNTSRIESYDDPAQGSIKIDAHWTHSELVVITIGEVERTVSGDELKRAIDNCMNV